MNESEFRLRLRMEFAINKYKDVTQILKATRQMQFNGRVLV